MIKNRLNWLYWQVFLSERQVRPNVGHATVQKLTPESATVTLHVKEGCISNFIDHILN